MSKQTVAAMILSLAVGAASMPQTASGQLPSASTASMATANNYTALARGFAAIALNPAGLAMPGNPGWSLALPTIEAREGLNALTLNDLATYEGIALPLATKDEWLQSVITEGDLTVRGGVAVTALALSFGPVGLQISSVGEGDVTMTPDAFELALYGNAGRTGTPRDMTLAGTRIDSWAATTAAVAFGLPLPGIQSGSFAAGATLKYTVGHVVATGGDEGSIIQGSPVRMGIMLPSIAPDSFTVNNGTGVGLDIGVAWEGETWAISGSVQNVFHTFQWDLAALSYRAGALTVDGTTVSDDFDAVPATNAPTALQDEVLNQSFKPALNLGVAYRPSEKLAVTADFRHDSGEALVHGEGSHIGMGVEFLVIPILPLRAGFSRVEGGTLQMAAGFGLKMGPVNLSGAYLTEPGAQGEYRAIVLALSFGHQ